MNTILDDISAVIGLSATLKLVAWYGDGVSNLYVPAAAADGQLLPKIIGLAAAKLLSNEWPGQHLHILRLHNYQIEMRKRDIARRIERGQSLREIASQLDMSERRVSQIKEDLRRAGLLAEPAAPAAVSSVAVLLGASRPAVTPAATIKGMDAMTRPTAASRPKGQELRGTSPSGPLSGARIRCSSWCVCVAGACGRSSLTHSQHVRTIEH